MKKPELKKNVGHSVYYQFGSSVWDLVDDSTECLVDDSMGDSHMYMTGYLARDLITNDLRKKLEKKE
jgi:hypothetical protein